MAEELNKTKINKDTVKLPSNFGVVMHMYIGYRCNTGIGSAKYSLFMVDKASRYKYIFKPKSLKNDTLLAFKKLITDMGFALKKIVTDFDHKLMEK